MNTPTKHIRCLKPSGNHKSYRFQRGVPGIKNGKTTIIWETLYNKDINGLNLLAKAGKLNKADLDARAELIKAALYKERDSAKPTDLLIPGNRKILEDFIKEKYPSRVLNKMGDRGNKSELNYLHNALAAIGNVPVDGNVDMLQTLIDKKFKTQRKKHARRVTSLNRLRKFLGLPPLVHLRKQIEEVPHLRLPEVTELIEKLNEPYKSLVGIAFYTGLRLGEIHGLKESDITGDVINVRRQITVLGNSTLPKNGKTRKAFIIPGGAGYLKSWFSYKEKIEATPVNKKDPSGPMQTVSRHLKVSEAIQNTIPKLKLNESRRQELKTCRFHDLRHSTAVYLIAKGATLDWVARVLGHSKETCERYYAGFVIDDDSIKLMRVMFKEAK